jgi:hypothetical protein
MAFSDFVVNKNQNGEPPPIAANAATVSTVSLDMPSYRVGVLEIPTALKRECPIIKIRLVTGTHLTHARL